MTGNLQKISEQLMRSQERLATQKNIRRPSDNPVGLMKIMNYRKDLHNLRQTFRNAESASMILAQTDIVLEQVGELTLDARNRANSMCTDTVGSDERLAVATEIELIIESVFQKANTKLGNRYIFSGHKILTEAYQRVGDQILYSGDYGTMEQRIELNSSITVNTPGENIFGSSDDGLFKVLIDLKNALEANDADAIRNAIPLLDEEMDRIASVRGEVGMKINRAEDSINELKLVEISLAAELSDIEDVDVVAESGEFMANQQAYQTALEATASILRIPNLLDFLS